MPKVSVIVPVYNVEDHIRRCLDSLINQTLDDMEIIVVNDGSTDDSEKIINEYLEKHKSKVKYVKKENGGLSDARNYGMKFASGEYIAFLDSDDYVDKTIYEKLYKRAVEGNCDYVECDFVWKYDDKEVIDRGNTYKDKREMIANGRVVAWNKLIKSKLINETKIQFPKGLIYEDVEFFYKLLPYIDKFAVVKEPLIYYVQREGSIANTQNRRTKDILDIWYNIIDFYKKNDFYNKYRAELEYAYTRIILCSSFLRVAKIKDARTRKELFSATWNNLNNMFPEWKKNKILLNNNSVKNRYMRSVNKVTFRIYSCIFRLKKN